jgi:hypothetical protein
MYIFSASMYIREYAGKEGIMATVRNRAHKHFQLDAMKIKRAQKVFKVQTETEAIERALDFAIDEHAKNQRVARAHERFLRSGIEIRDVYGNLED